jgi:hypothetical protein
LVEPVLPGAVRERARVGTGPDHCLVDAVGLPPAAEAREHGPGHLVVYCEAVKSCRSTWYSPRHEPVG